MHRHAHRIGKLGGGEARKQTQPSDNALKEHAALLCRQLAGGGHDNGKLVVAKGEHRNESVAGIPMVFHLRRMSTARADRAGLGTEVQ